MECTSLSSVETEHWTAQPVNPGNFMALAEIKVRTIFHGRGLEVTRLHTDHYPPDPNQVCERIIVHQPIRHLLPGNAVLVVTDMGDCIHIAVNTDKQIRCVMTPFGSAQSPLAVLDECLTGNWG